MRVFVGTDRGPWDLSPREREVCLLLGSGKTPKEIAFDLKIAASTVRVLMGRARKKLTAATAARV
jgi:DNA-binding CsgD family transcriptional regulator